MMARPEPRIDVQIQGKLLPVTALVSLVSFAETVFECEPHQAWMTALDTNEKGTRLTIELRDAEHGGDTKKAEVR